MIRYLFPLLVLSPALGAAQTATQAAADPLARAFAAESATGTMLVRRLSDGREWVHNPARADSAYLPASTFKIVNASIALETGVVSGPGESFRWDGVQREFESWNQDHTLRSAMAASAVPVYQEVARRIGEPRMSQWLRGIGYGNTDTGGGLDQFWLTGALRTSAREQVDFLERYLTGRTPFRAATVDSVSAMLVNNRGEGWSLYAKSGWAFEVQLGWWVGWTRYRGETYVFALNMAMPDASYAPRRMRIGRAALAGIGALPG